ncbi:MAG: hypothetical protein ABW104_04475 [Candidatus Thiodiazotropha sp. 6PLUC2]
MSHFTPCQGKNACRDNGTICLTCGRELTEIVKLRELMKEITSLAVEYDYENVDDFTQYVARKITKMIDYQRANPDTSIEINADAN